MRRWRGGSWATSCGGWRCTSCSQDAVRYRWRRGATCGGAARWRRGCCRVWLGCRPALTSTPSAEVKAGSAPPSHTSPADLWTFTNNNKQFLLTSQWKAHLKIYVEKCLFCLFRVLVSLIVYVLCFDWSFNIIYGFLWFLWGLCWCCFVLCCSVWFIFMFSFVLLFFFYSVVLFCVGVGVMSGAGPRAVGTGRGRWS